MKIIWEAEDIQAGRVIGKPTRGERWMIGYDPTVPTDADGARWTLNSLSDGMVSARFSRQKLAERLNASEELPVEIFDPKAL